MSVVYYPIDPAFNNPDNSYAEHGTAGYNGCGWYYFCDGRLCGPFDSEREAKDTETTPSNVDGWENEGGR
jgi:hypothetical protein